KSCCPSTTARNIYNTCRFGGGSRTLCAKLSGCKIVSGTTCPK
nr:Chain A, urthionin-Uf1a [Urtica ferox]